MWIALITAALALSPRQQQEDIEQVRTLLRSHPDADDPSAVARWSDALDAVPTTGDLEPHRFIGRLLSALAVVRDGHTDSILHDEAVDAFLGLDGFLPYDMMVFEDQLYLDPRFHEPARVVSIDGHSGSEIVTALRQTVVSDSVTPSTTDGALDRTFSNLYAKHYGLSDSYEVVLDRGEPVRTSVAGGSYDDVPYIGDPLPNATSLEGGVLTVTLNEIMPGKEWRAFTRAIRRGLREAQGVVLDLRDCGGGFAPTGHELLNRFATRSGSFSNSRRIGRQFAEGQEEGSMYRIVYTPDETGSWTVKPHLRDVDVLEVEPPRRPWEGPLVMLVGPGTFSACSDLASELRPHREGLLVLGSETSGGARRLNAGKFDGVLLSHSGIYVQVPLVQFTRSEAFGELGRGVVPDRTLADRPDTNGDEVMACARALALGEECVEAERPGWLSAE